MNRNSGEGLGATRRILVVDFDDGFRSDAAQILREAGYVVAEAAGALDAMRAVLAGSLDVVVLDLELPDGPGIDVARAFRAVATTRDICVVAMTAHPATVELIDPKTFGAQTILVKPLEANELLTAVENCFGDDERWRAEFQTPVDGAPQAEAS